MTKIPRAALALMSMALAGTTLEGCGSKPVHSPTNITTETRTPFLSPLKISMVLDQNDPRVTAACRTGDEPDACQPVWRYGGGAGGSGPVIPPVFGAEAPHLWLGFLLTDVSNTAVVGGGIPSLVDDLFLSGLGVEFRFDSPAIAGQPTDYVGLGILANPGESDNPLKFIWRGLIENGCESPPAVIPINFSSTLEARLDSDGNYPPESGVGQEVTVDLFETTDDSSLVPTGFWNFHYTQRASVNGGDLVSDIDFSGKVSLLCTSDLNPLQSGGF